MNPILAVCYPAGQKPGARQVSGNSAHGSPHMRTTALAVAVAALLMLSSTGCRNRPSGGPDTSKPGTAATQPVAERGAERVAPAPAPAVAVDRSTPQATVKTLAAALEACDAEVLRSVYAVEGDMEPQALKLMQLMVEAAGRLRREADRAYGAPATAA